MTGPRTMLAASSTSGPAAQDYTPPAWAFLVGDLRTGRITTEVPILSPRFEAPLNDAGAFAGELSLADPDLADLNPALTLAPARTFLAVELNGTILYGGPIWSHRYNKRTQRLRIAGAGLWSVWDHRKVLPVLDVDPTGNPYPDGAYLDPASTAGDTALTGYTLAGIARRLIAQAFAHTGGALPVVHPDGRPITVDPGDEAGSAERNYYGYNLAWLGDALRELTGVEAGPDLELRPRRRADAPEFIEWELRRGAPYLTQAGPAWLLEEPDVVDVDVDVDGTGIAHVGWVTGEGTQREMLIRRAVDLAAITSGAPLLEAQEDHRSATIPATVTDHAEALVALRAAAVEQWTVTVRTDAELAPSTYAVGDRFTVPIADDPYLAEGDYLTRCTSIGGDGQHMTLTMQPSSGSL